MATIKHNHDDVQLLQRVLQGDDRARGTLCQRYTSLIELCVRKTLRRYGVARLGAHDVEDLVADVWVLLLTDDCRRLRAFDPARGYRLSSWIGQITTNHTIDQLRRRRNDSYLEDVSQPDLLTVNHATPHDLLERRQAVALAERAFAVLKDDDRAFIIASYHEERSPAEMAKALGVSVNTVYSRRFKVRERLTRLAEGLMAPVAAPAALAA